MADKKYNVILTATDETRAAFDSARSGVEGFNAPLTSMQGLLTTISEGAMVALVKSGIDAAAKLHDLAIQSHASVEALSAMRLSAEQTGTPMESVAASIAKLSKSIGEARATGGVKDDLFKTLGIDVSSGRDMADIMQDLAHKLAAMGDQQAADYVSSQLLGKSYSELAPFMANIVEKGKLVAEVSTKQADEANKLNDRIIGLTHSFKLMLENENVVNKLNDIYDAVEKSNKESGKWSATLTGLRTAMDLAFGQPISEIGKTEQEVGRLFNRIEQIKQSIETHNNAGAIGKFFDGGDSFVVRMKKELDDANAALRHAIDVRDALYHQQNNEATPGAPAGDASAAVLNAKKVAEAQAASKKIIEIAQNEDASTTASHEDAFFKWLDGWKKTEDKLTALGAAGTNARKLHESAYTVYVNAENTKRNADANKADAIKAAQLAADLNNEKNYYARIQAMADDATGTAIGREKKRYDLQMQDLEKHHKEMAAKVAGDHALALAEEEAYQVALGNIKAIHQAADLQADETVAAMARAFSTENKTEEISSTAAYFAKLSSYQASHSHTMFEINKVASIAVATMNTYRGISGVLAEFPGPVGWAMAAAQAALGIAQVMAIQSTSFGGGSPSAGGSGVPSMATSPGIPVAPSYSAPPGSMPIAAQPPQQINLTIVGAAANPDAPLISFNTFVNDFIPIMKQAKDNGYLVDFNVTMG